MLRAFSALTAETVLGLAAASISATGSDAKSGSSRFLCHAYGAGDTDFSASYEERVENKGTSAKFLAEFETSTTDGFVAGQPVVFSVDAVVVGTVPLASVGPEIWKPSFAWIPKRVAAAITNLSRRLSR